MTRKTRRSMAERLIDQKIERAYYVSCSGVQIDIMNIGKVFEHGRELLAAGADDTALAYGLRTFVEKLS